LSYTHAIVDADITIESASPLAKCTADCLSTGVLMTRAVTLLDDDEFVDTLVGMFVRVATVSGYGEGVRRFVPSLYYRGLLLISAETPFSQLPKPRVIVENIKEKRGEIIKKVSEMNDQLQRSCPVCAI